MNHIQIIVGLGILVNKKNEILITQRYDPGNPQIHLRWQLPGGGVEFGETVEEAVVREMKEEVSVDVTLLHHPPVIGTSIWEYPGKKIQCFLFGYMCRADGQNITIGCTETSDFTWIRPDDIEQYDCLPKAKEFIEQAKKMMKMDILH